MQINPNEIIWDEKPSEINPADIIWDGAEKPTENVGLARPDPETGEIPELTLGRLGSQAYRGAAQGLGDQAHGFIAEEREKDPIADERMFQATGLDKLSPVERGLLGPLVSEATTAKGSPLDEQEISDLRVAFKTNRSKEYIEKLSSFAESLPKPLPGSSGIIEDAVGGVSRFGPGMLLTAVNAPIGTISMFNQLYGQKYNELTEGGIEHETAREVALLTSSINTPLEQAGSLFQIGMLKKLFSKTGIAAGIGPRLRQFIGVLMANTGGEGLEEYLQQYPDEIANIYAANHDKSGKEIADEVLKQLPRISEGAKQAAKVGAVGGLIMTGGVQAAGAPFNIADYRAEKKTEQEETVEPEYTPEDITRKAQQIKTALDSGDATTAQLREALKQLPKEHIHALAINEALKDEKPTSRPIDLTAPKQTGADYIARFRNQEKIDQFEAEQLQAEQAAELEEQAQIEAQKQAEEEYWERQAGDIRGQQLQRQIGLGRQRLGETRPTTLQQDVSRETVAVPETTEIAPEGAVTPVDEAIIPEVAPTDRRTKQLKGLRIKEKRAGEERRKDEIRRKKVSELLPEEKDLEIGNLREEARQDHRTPLLNQKAFEDDKMEEDQASPMAQLDLEKFKWINDKTTPGTLPTGEVVKGAYPLGNDILKAFGGAINEALEETGIKDQTTAYRSGGDEFTIVGATPGELEAFNALVEEKANKIKVDILGSNGVHYVLNGLPFSRGIGEGYDNAIKDYKANKADRTKHGLRLTGRGAKPATLFRAGEREGGRDSKSDRDQRTVKKGFRHKKEQPSKVRTMRGAIKALGGINFLNYKGELRDMPTAVKYLQRKNGTPIDSLVRQLREDNWLEPDATVSSFLEDLRTDSKRLLSRDRLTVDLSDKKEYQKSAEEKKFEKELAHEPEAPPEGKYVQMNAEDLPMGKKLTLLEDKSPSGWDVYTVEEKDPFTVTLKDGIEIELKPLDKVEVLKEDLPKPSEAAESIKPETKPVTPEKEKVAEKTPQVKPAVGKKAAKEPPTDMFGQPVPTDMFGEEKREPEKQKRERKTKEKRTPSQAQKPLFGEDKTQIQPELPIGKKESKKDTLKTIIPEMGKGLKYETEAEVAETGEVVKISQDAAEALIDIEEKIFSYKQLLDCI